MLDKFHGLWREFIARTVGVAIKKGSEEVDAEEEAERNRDEVVNNVQQNEVENEQEADEFRIAKASGNFESVSEDEHRGVDDEWHRWTEEAMSDVDGGEA